jgi:serine/threonine protein kinase/tetratricopeptide (TPR) repeat protein
MATERFLDMAASLADGSPINWDDTDSAVSSEAERRLLRQLRVVQDIADLHRSTVDDDGDYRPPDIDEVWTTISEEPARPAGRDLPLRWSPTSDHRDTSGPANEASRPPRVWGHLHLLEKVGEGSFGEVYRAYDRRLSRDVALKLLRADARTHTPLAERLLREGRALARVHHQNVVTVFGAEEHDGRVGLWMELVEGRTLAESVAREGPYSAREATLIGQDLCRALAAVHAAGLVHRDIKAQNVMRQHGGRVVLMDFGAGELRDRPTRAGRVRVTGTPLSTAPEVLAGAPADPSSDIYSLGVLLFYLVTGRFPVEADTLEELRGKHAQRTHTNLHDVRPDLPDSFVSVVERAIEVEPERRYATAGVFQRALGRAFGVEQPVVTPDRTEASLPRGPRSATLRRHWGAHSRLLAAAAVLTLVLLALSLAIRWRSIPTSPGESALPVLVLRLVEPATPGSGYVANRLAEQVHRELGLLRGGFDVAALDALRTLPASANGPTVLHALRAEYLLEGIVDRNAKSTSVRLRLLRAGADAPAWRQQLTRPNDQLSRLRDDIVRVVAERVSARKVEAVRASVNEHAYDAYLRGRYAFSQRRYDDAIGYLNKARSLQPDFADAWAELGKVYLWRFWSLGVRQTRREAIEAARLSSQKALELDPDVPEAHAVLADIAFTEDWDWERAEREFRMALASNPSDVVARFELAMFLAARGRTSEAIDEIERGRRLNPLSAETVGYAGMAYYYAREYTRAVREFRAALSLEPGLIPPHVGLCRALRAQGDLAGAQQACQSAADKRFAELTEPSRAALDPEWNAAQAEIAQVRALVGDRAGAEAILSALLNARSQSSDSVSAYRFALVRASLGDADEAFTWLDEAFAERLREVQFAATDPRLDGMRRDHRFGEYLSRLGSPAQAVEMSIVKQDREGK